MHDDMPISLLDAYTPPGRRRRQLLALLGLAAALVLPLLVLLLPQAGAQVSDRASTAALLLTAAAFVVTAWQFRAQRLELASEAYFSRLNIPNERRLAFCEQILALADRVDHDALADALEQHFVFYVFAELDNLEYVARKYEHGHSDRDVALRAVEAFRARCEQSRDFGETVNAVVGASGYEPRFVQLVRALMAHCRMPAGVATSPARNPMRYDELEVVRRLRLGPP
jgi:hypothetical protein